MIKKYLFVFLFVSLQANAQLTKKIDSLFLVKSYLLNIQHTVNSKEESKQKLAKLDNFVKSATAQKAVFNKNIAKIVENKQEIEQLKSSLNFILQSLALYKSDISNNKSGLSEKKYLNQNIPPLIDKIIFYCKRLEENIKFETH